MQDSFTIIFLPTNGRQFWYIHNLHCIFFCFTKHFRGPVPRKGI